MDVVEGEVEISLLKAKEEDTKVKVEAIKARVEAIKAKAEAIKAKVVVTRAKAEVIKAKVEVIKAKEGITAMEEEDIKEVVAVVEFRVQAGVGEMGVVVEDIAGVEMITEDRDDKYKVLIILI